jgi:hypothetical protein
MPEHRWSGWPGAWCLDCGAADPREDALAEGNCTEDGIAIIDESLLECKEPGSNRFNPYAKREEK